MMSQGRNKTNAKMLGAAALFAAAALALCIFLSVHSIADSAVPGCGAGSDCGSVLSGRWSKLFGFLPIAALGAGMYLATLVCLVLRLTGKDEGIEDLVSGALVLLCTAIIAADLWFIGLQIHDGTFCRWCMATHVLGIAMSVLVLLSGPFRLKPALAGVALAAMLATVQLLTTPASRSAAGSTQSALPVAQAGTFPFIGDPSAPAVEVLFDYRCPHCRDLHALLPQIAAEKHLAFVLCPTPLSPACNAYIPAGEDRFPGSCELAKAALALWQESPDAFREFDEWAFAAGPSGKWEMKDGQAALAKARELAGKYGINADLQGAGVRERLSLTLEIFGRTSLKGSGGIPRLVYGQQWLIPETVDAGDLSEMIDSLIKS